MKQGLLVGLACAIAMWLAVSIMHHGHSAPSPVLGDGLSLATIMTPWDPEMRAEVAAVIGTEWVQAEDRGAQRLSDVQATSGVSYISKVPAEMEASYRDLVTWIAGTYDDTIAQSRASLLIRFDHDVTSDLRDSFARVMGGHLVRHWERSGVYEYTVPVGVELGQYVAWVKLSPLVRSVEVNRPVYAADVDQ